MCPSRSSWPAAPRPAPRPRLPAGLGRPRRERHLRRHHLGLRPAADPPEHGRARSLAPRRHDAARTPSPSGTATGTRWPSRTRPSRSSSTTPPAATSWSRRLREGRITLSPFLDNTLWGCQSEEGLPPVALPRPPPRARVGHPDRRGAPLGAALASLGCRQPAGRGRRALAGRALLDYDSEWGSLDVPPAVRPRGARRRGGPRGSRRVGEPPPQLHPGARAPRGPEAHRGDWLPRFEALGPAYPFRDILALGTHGDLGAQSAGEVDRLRGGDPGLERRRRRRPRVSSTRRSPPSAARSTRRRRACPRVRGDLGHSWEAWPVTLAAHAAAARQAEREMRMAEALVALAGGESLAASTREARERAEWSWAMLGDHAWNGTDDANRSENASLRLAGRAPWWTPRATWMNAGMGRGRPRRLDHGGGSVQPDRRRAPGRGPLSSSRRAGPSARPATPTTIRCPASWSSRTSSRSSTSSPRVWRPSPRQPCASPREALRPPASWPRRPRASTARSTGSPWIPAPAGSRASSTSRPGASWWSPAPAPSDRPSTSTGRRRR